jgi:transcription termination/antitermination protein NusG
MFDSAFKLRLLNTALSAASCSRKLLLTIAALSLLLIFSAPRHLNTQNRNALMNQLDSTGSSAFALPWYVVRCKANAERTVAHSLTNRGITVFLPLERRPSKRKKIGYIETPLFPGYIFAQFQYRESLLVVACPGVVNILCRGPVPEPVDTAEINSLLTLTKQAVSMSPLPIFEKGDKVRITSGPLADVEGVIVRDSGNQKLIVSVSLLRRSVVAQVDREWIEVQDSSPTRLQVTSWSSAAVGV